MSAIVAKSRTVASRNKFGQFTSEIEHGCDRAVDRWVELGAATSREMAPVGGERKENYSRRPGYIPLKASIHSKSNGHTGYWYTNAPHWKFVEYDTSGHPITGFLNFPWSGNADGEFRWHHYGYSNWTASKGATVNHPGTGAQKFLEPAYKLVVRRQMMSILKQEMP